MSSTEEAIPAWRAGFESALSVLEQLPVGVALAIADTGAFVYQNPAATGILGHPLIDALSPADYGVFGALDAKGDPLPSSDYPLVQVMRTGVSVTQAPLRYRRGDGEIVKLEVSASRIRRDAGQPDLAIAVFEDVTARVSAEAALQARETDLRQVLESTTDCVFHVGRDWRLTFLNRRAADQIAGGRDLLGAVIWDAFPQAVGSTFEQAYRTAMVERRPVSVEQYFAPLDRWFAATAYPTQDGLAVYFRDVTAQRRAEEDRQLVMRELDHRIKNLFSVLLGMVGATARAVTTPVEMANALRGRISALAKAHALLQPEFSSTQEPASPTLEALASSVLAPYLSLDALATSMTGPSWRIGQETSIGLALILHELATNAAKHGALSIERRGELSLVWRREGEMASVDWWERGVAASPPPKGASGFGLRLIDMTIRSRLRGEIAYAWGTDGLRVTLLMPFAQLER